MSKENSLSVFYGPIMVLLLVAGAFFVGRLSAQVENLKSVDTSNKTGETGLLAEDGEKAVAEGVDISVTGLKNIAKQLKLKERDFNSCLDEGKYAKKVTDDQSAGTAWGVSGTPTFFINGVRLVGAQPQAQFEGVIEAELKGEKQVLGAGTDETGSVRVDVNYGNGYVKGKSDAQVKMIEFSDFECPYCKSAAPTVKAVQDKYGDKLSLEYRHFPLAFHSKAQKAAEAAECAGEQGKFWEFHDKIFGV